MNRYERACLLEVGQRNHHETIQSANILSLLQLGYVLAQIAETDKKPRAGTSPLKAVPLRLDLSREQVEDILGY